MDSHSPIREVTFPLKAKNPLFSGFFSAEREGFEPPVGSSPTTVFKTVAINRSAISPRAKIETRLIFQNVIEKKFFGSLFFVFYL
jgi:hypothetical protein